MSGAKGVVRKLFDSGPVAVTSNTAYDGSGSPTTSWASGIAGPIWITALTQGATDNDRIGFSIAAESLDLTLIVNPDNGASANGNNVLRVLMVADNECDGSTPQLAEILGNAQQSDTTVATGFVASHLQPGFFGRFHVLMDEYWNWTFNNAISFYQTDKPFCHRRHFDLHDHRIMWDMSDSSAIANARKGHIFMYFIYQTCTTAVGGLPTLTTSNPPSIQYMARFRYRDA